MLQRLYFERPATAIVRIALRDDEVLSLRAAPGDFIQVLRGGVWITQAGDPVDHVLDRDETFCVDRSGAVVVNALAPTLVAVCSRGAAAAKRVLQAQRGACKARSIPSVAQTA